MSVRWMRAVVEGPGGCSATQREDTVLFETDAAIALAAIEGPAVVLSVGEWRLRLEGRETLESLSAAIAAAYAEQARREMRAV